MRLVAIACVLAAMLLAGAPSRAESPNAEALTAARELIATMKATDNFKAILPTITQGLKPVIVQGRPAVEKDFDTIMPSMLDAMTSRLPELAELMAQIYARTFTASELRDIQAFYGTPTGQKLLQNMPALAQLSMAAGQRFGQDIGAELRARITNELRKRGHDI
jgi:uncharacterized protein